MDLLKQPRIDESNYKGSNIEAAGIINVTADDLPDKYSYKYRESIIKRANEVYHLGKIHNREYARILNAKTGKLATRKMFVQDSTGKIYLDKTLLEESAENSLIIVHNHPNGSFFSDYDISVLVQRKSVECIYLASNGRLLRVARGNDISYNVLEDIVGIQIRKLAYGNKSKGYYYAGCVDKEFNNIKAILAEYGICVERW